MDIWHVNVTELMLLLQNDIGLDALDSRPVTQQGDTDVCSVLLDMMSP